MRTIAILSILAAAAVTAWGQDRPAKKLGFVPVEFKLTAKTAVYPLDLGGKTAKDFLALLKKAKAGDVAPPPPPKVDLLAEIKNVSRNDVAIWSEGDPVVLELTVKGPGAQNMAPPIPMTLEFRIPKEAKIAPQESFIIPISSLKSGHRGSSRFSYWTEPGEYEIHATFRTGVAPPPPGAEVADGFGTMTLSAPPIKVKVAKEAR